MIPPKILFCEIIILFGMNSLMVKIISFRMIFLALLNILFRKSFVWNEFIDFIKQCIKPWLKHFFLKKLFYCSKHFVWNELSHLLGKNSLIVLLFGIIPLVVLVCLFERNSLIILSMFWMNSIIILKILLGMISSIIISILS